MIDYLRSLGFSIKGTDFQKLLKINKLSYFIESRMYEHKIKSFNYHFRKWDHGPLAQEIYIDIDNLNETHLIKKTDIINVQDEGKQLLRNLDEMLIDENEVIDCVKHVVREFGEYQWDEIKSTVYAYPTVDKRIRMDRIRKGTPILSKLERSEAVQAVRLNPDWFDTLKIIFNPDIYHSVKQGIESLRSDPGEDFDEFVKTLELR